MHDIIGCYLIVNKKNGSLYDQEELELCEHIAALAAMTIDEKGFYVELEEKKEVLISLRNVTKQYQTGETANLVLKGINLDIYKNEFVVVLGESGCGKSTMMNIIGGMDFLTSGDLLIEGKNFSRPTDDQLTKYRREYVGFIFQAYNLMPNLTALENVEYIAELVEDHMSSEEAIAKVGLSERANNYPGQMSGGQQQRVSIARALVKKPKLILADEPTAALDYTTSIEVLDVIENIIKTKGTTVMMVTHNAEIAKMADRVIKVRNGKIASIKKNLHPLHATELVW
jgi:ABC-type lipoprotein export system ATPase subunit